MKGSRPGWFPFISPQRPSIAARKYFDITNLLVFLITVELDFPFPLNITASPRNTNNLVRIRTSLPALYSDWHCCGLYQGWLIFARQGRQTTLMRSRCIFQHLRGRFTLLVVT